jgi:hypothetical protein
MQILGRLKRFLKSKLKQEVTCSNNSKFKELNRIARYNAQIRRSLAMVYLNAYPVDKTQIKEAKKLLEEQYLLYPLYPQSLLALGNYCYKLHDYNHAKAFFREAAYRLIDAGDPYLSLAKIFYQGYKTAKTKKKANYMLYKIDVFLKIAWRHNYCLSDKYMKKYYPEIYALKKHPKFKDHPFFQKR